MLYYSIPIILAILILPGFAFGETEMDTDPFTVGSQFDSKPLDEAEQDMEDLTDLWTICIALVVGMVIARVAFKIIKKRLKNRN